MRLLALRLSVVVNGKAQRVVDLLINPVTGQRTGEYLEGGKDTEDNKRSLQQRGIEVLLIDQQFTMDHAGLRRVLQGCDWRKKAVTKAPS